MRTQTNLPLVVTIALTASVPSALALTPVSQSRSVSASAEAVVPGVPGSNDADSVNAPGFGLFDATASASAAAISASPRASSFADAVATQVSDHSVSSISASGLASIDLLIQRPGTLPGLATASSEAVSLFDLVFTIDTFTPFTLVGSVFTDIGAGSPGSPLLDNEFYLESVTYNSVIFETTSVNEGFNAYGVLAPGTYRFYAEASAIGDLSTSMPGITASLIGQSGFEFEFNITNFTVVPESGTVFAVGGLGLLCGLTWMQRRRVLAA